MFLFNNDVMSEIAKYITPTELCVLLYQAGRSCRNIMAENGEESMWRSLLMRDYSTHYSTSPATTGGRSWFTM